MSLQNLYTQVMGRLRDSADATKVASVRRSDELLAAKSAHDLETIQLIKEAVSLGQVGKVLGGGLLAGAGASVPAYLTGRHLIGKGEEAAKRQQEEAAKNFRNKALQVALGVGGIGAGLMGLHHVLKSRRQAAEQPEEPATSTEAMARAQELAGLMPHYKYSSAEDDLLEKLATVAYLDCILEGAEKTGALEDATAQRHLNAEHGVHILQQLLS
jgi:hypothetical protein